MVINLSLSKKKLRHGAVLSDKFRNLGEAFPRMVCRKIIDTDCSAIQGGEVPTGQIPEEAVYSTTCGKHGTAQNKIGSLNKA